MYPWSVRWIPKENKIIAMFYTLVVVTKNLFFSHSIGLKDWVLYSFKKRKCFWKFVLGIIMSKISVNIRLLIVSFRIKEVTVMLYSICFYNLFYVINIMDLSPSPYFFLAVSFSEIKVWLSLKCYVVSYWIFSSLSEFLDYLNNHYVERTMYPPNGNDELEFSVHLKLKLSFWMFAE
jgi:hypothetical protein